MTRHGYGRRDRPTIGDNLDILPATAALRRLRRDVAAHRMRRRAIARMAPGETQRDLARQEARVAAMLLTRLTGRPNSQTSSHRYSQSSKPD